MTPTLLFLLPAGLGIALAGKAAPINCGWPSERLSLTLRRVRALALVAPSRRRRLAMGAALAGVIAAGGLAAYAAEPSTPDQLPSEVVGVLGSGDQLSLQIKSDGGVRAIKPGDDYKDGWKLQALTNTTATLGKDGASRTVGLNPTGEVVVATPTGPPSTVTALMSPEDQAILDSLIKSGMTWLSEGKPLPGLSFAETQRHMIDKYKMIGSTGDGDPSLRLGVDDYEPGERAILGDAAYNRFVSEAKRMAQAQIAQGDLGSTWQYQAGAILTAEYLAQHPDFRTESGLPKGRPDPDVAAEQQAVGLLLTAPNAPHPNLVEQHGPVTVTNPSGFPAPRAPGT